jgi:hypothetical protein
MPRRIDIEDEWEDDEEEFESDEGDTEFEAEEDTERAVQAHGCRLDIQHCVARVGTPARHPYDRAGRKYRKLVQPIAPKTSTDKHFVSRYDPPVIRRIARPFREDTCE